MAALHFTTIPCEPDTAIWHKGGQGPGGGELLEKLGGCVACFAKPLLYLGPKSATSIPDQTHYL